MTWALVYLFLGSDGMAAIEGFKDRDSCMARGAAMQKVLEDWPQAERIDPKSFKYDCIAMGPKP